MDDKDILLNWFNTRTELYSDDVSRRISYFNILDNNEQLDGFFKHFRDYTPVTDEEK